MAKKSTKESKTKSKYAVETLFSKKGFDNFQINAQNLRNLANANPIVKICINRLKKTISKSPYIIKAIDKKENDALKPEIDFLKKLLKTPNNNNETFRTLMIKTLDDVLILDQGIIEKVKNIKGEIKELYHVDGSTIKSMYDDYGILESPAFEQYLRPGDREPSASFEKEDLLIFQSNPKSQNDMLGKGESPLEGVILTVLTSINALIYNASIFDESKIPPAIVNLKGFSPELLKQFKQNFESQIQGKQWTNAYTNAEDMNFQLLRPNNQDMQFYELNLWLFRIICAAYDLSPQEFGFTMDINKATAQSQENISKKGGYEIYADVVAEEINNSIIGDLALINPKFSRVEFAWDLEDRNDDLKQAQIDEIYTRIGKVLPNELRIRDGEDPLTYDQELSIAMNKLNSGGEKQKEDNEEDLITKSFNKINKTKWETFY